MARWHLRSHVERGRSVRRRWCMTWWLRCSPGGRAMPTTGPTTGRWLLGVALLFAAYVAAGKFGLALAVINSSASAVWLPTGIALAGVLLGGSRLWPAIALGAFLVNVTTTGHVATSLGIAAGNTGEALLGGWMLE